ncbi:hypothetical protein NDU88_002468 [Pleurodeles waltl]|uniref:Uncharacterized protein n=1 Tax=Pleurodeles waltl TaxID=8319 RepID=A0AAV7WPM2_PLEWA|nr:hypothetical protein NDU88_002468 [Pleurodeles waltl]
MAERRQKVYQTISPCSFEGFEEVLKSKATLEDDEMDDNEKEGALSKDEESEGPDHGPEFQGETHSTPADHVNAPDAHDGEGSSVFARGLSPQELEARKMERKLKLELAKLRMDKEMSAHGLKLKEVDIKAR